MIKRGQVVKAKKAKSSRRIIGKKISATYINDSFRTRFSEFQATMNPITTTTRIPAKDRLNPRTMKLTRGISVGGPQQNSIYITLRRESDLRYCKTNPMMPSFSVFSNEQRTITILTIKSLGNTPSAVASKMVGLLTHQIGAIRRWHIPSWRDMGNTQIRNASN